jgi:O-antigen ligase
MNQPADQVRTTVADWVVLFALSAGALACVLLVLPYRSFDLDRFFAPKELAFHAAALVAGGAALAFATRLTISKVDAALLAWLALSAASALAATNRGLAFRALAITVSSATVFWAARKVGRTALGPVLTRVLALSVVAGALMALAQAYGIKMEFAALNRAPGGTFGNRNFMAHLTAAGIPLVMWSIASAKRNRGAWLWTVSLAICTVALVLSRTRAAWLALAVTGVLAVVVIVRGPALLADSDSRRRMRRALAAIVVSVIVALVMPNALDWRSDSPYLDSMKGVVDYREGSGRGRLAQYANSIKMAERHPLLGVGAGNWPVIYPKFAPPNDPSLADATGMTANPWPSSDWIAAVSERGWAAVVALASFVLLLFFSALRVRYDPARSSEQRLAATVGGGVVLIAALEGGFDAVLLLPTPAIVVMAAAGALILPAAAGRVISPSPAKKFAGGMGFAAFMIAACVMSDRRVEAMKLYEVGTSAAIESALSKDPGSYRIQMRAADYFVSRGQCAKARTHALSARALFPSSPGPRRALAKCGGLSE